MDKQKTKWDVYVVSDSMGSRDIRFVGSTYAVSSAKAISNIRYRTKIRDTVEEHRETYLEAHPS